MVSKYIKKERENTSQKIRSKIREVINTKNNFENKVVRELVEGLSGGKPENIEVRQHKFQMHENTKYVLIHTHFETTYTMFIRSTFSGRSGQKYHPDILIFEGENPPGRKENQTPAVLIEIKSGKQTTLLNRKFIYQILSETLDLMPKLSVLITQNESDQEADISLGYEGISSYYGIHEHTELCSNDSPHHIRDCLPTVIFNGIAEEFTRKKFLRLNADHQ